jgi:peptide chain release factor 3
MDSTTTQPQNAKHEITRRRTFAIISHPDAGKTTLTEKLLLYGGAIRQAGAVKAKSNQTHTTSDWMEIEKKRGISISTSVLQFDYHDFRINLLDTPGHKDFSEDTYRTLTAADAAVMLIDAAKGVEPQTRKLFEVCRMRGLPIFTFINKMDRPGRDPFDLMDELEKVLKIRSCPMSWPIGSGDQFRGIYDRQTKEVLLFEKDGTANARGKLAAKQFKGVDDPGILELLKQNDDSSEPERLYQKFREEIDLLEMAGDQFDEERVLSGELTPIFFGSAMNNFGVEHFLERFIKFAPCPGPRKSSNGEIQADSSQFSGFIFKIQANMNPMHRDRIAFMRICSGKFVRGIATVHGRLGRDVRLSKVFHFFGQDREMIEEAWPGDIVGVLDTSGDILIGDTLAQGKRIEYDGVPQFSPENFSTVANLDPMKRKQLKKGIEQLTEEGVVQVYFQPGQGDVVPILGAVGELQFEIFKQRIETEYGIKIRMERMTFGCARWITGDKAAVDAFQPGLDMKKLEDRNGNPVILFLNEWAVNYVERKNPELKFLQTAPLKRAKED